MIDKYPTRKSGETTMMPRTELAAYDVDSVYGIREYSETGFFHYKDFFDLSEVIEASYQSRRIYEGSLDHEHLSQEPNSSLVRSALNVHGIEGFRDLLESKALSHVSESILGGESYIHQSRINYKNSYGSAGWDWHSDFETWHSQDGMPEMRAFTAMIPLTPNTNENGCLMVVPQSHKLFCSCAKSSAVFSAEEEFSEQKEGIPPPSALTQYFKGSEGVVSIVCNPGDLVIFDCNTLHVSHPNLTPDPRTNLFFVFNSVENRLAQPFSGGTARPGYMAHRI